MNRPEINVTPLIDVLLVLLIIFMIVTPTRPSSLETRVPSEPAATRDVTPHPDTIVIRADRLGNLSVNNSGPIATVAEPDEMIALLMETFAERLANNAFRTDPKTGKTDIERTVFIKAPKALDYGSVARIVDSVKLAGASPVSLQIDQLEQ